MEIPLTQHCLTDTRYLQQHLSTIDALRGIASFAVCWFHLTGFQMFVPVLWLRYSGAYGYLGVPVFFVISGFIIPYALHRARYQILGFPHFLAKRVVRLDPPYLATIVLWLVYQYLASHTALHRGGAANISWKQVLAHVGYVNAFIGLPWFVDVFWTLAIEFQYYIAVGLLFPVIASRRPGRWVWIYVFVAAASVLAPNNAFLFHHLPIFLLGILVFRFRCLGVPRGELAAGLLIAIGLGLATNGWLATLAGTISAAAILLVQYTNPILTFLGDISYSLYLTHNIVGSIVIIQASRWLGIQPITQILLVTAGVGVSLVTAYLMHRYIEEPAKHWAAKIKYAHSPEAAKAVVAS